jgi:hypothetical protein
LAHISCRYWAIFDFDKKGKITSQLTLGKAKIDRSKIKISCTEMPKSNLAMTNGFVLTVGLTLLELKSVG